MSALLDILRRQIRQSGPVSLAEYMALCLSHPQHGYYMTRDPFGTRGDFTTAPEISQMFGELLGLWMAQVWADQERPSPFLLVELGPGRGTLMADMLRAARGVSGFVENARIHLVETSPVLQGIQRTTLREHPVAWLNSVEELPEDPVFAVANEFFDALPVRQFARARGGWCERVVGLDGETLRFGLAPASPMPVLEARHPGVKDGGIVEFSPVAEAIAAQLGARVSRDGGAVLVTDYGDWHGTGDTFQAMQNHETVDQLAAPGATDLTAHVNFSALAGALHPARVSEMSTQGRFLEALGITGRAKVLAGAGGRGTAGDIAAQHRRLTHPDEMGNLFKVIAATAPGAPEPPGFA